MKYLIWLWRNSLGIRWNTMVRIVLGIGGDILLLDEISSSLDEPTERELYSRLLAAFPDKTMLFITHRPTVSKLCDDVIKFERI